MHELKNFELISPVYYKNETNQYLHELSSRDNVRNLFHLYPNFDELFALKSWAQAMSEEGINCIFIQYQIDLASLVILFALIGYPKKY